MSHGMQRSDGSVALVTIGFFMILSVTIVIISVVTSLLSEGWAIALVIFIHWLGGLICSH